jgi:uncharacterized protein YutE (UPF0331/DUF86 family)
MTNNRYREKIEYIIEALEQIPEKPERPIEISGTFYNLHTSIESAMDIIAMLLRDLGFRVEDDYSNIEKLVELKVIDEKLGEKLKMCNGLRNWLVHRYNRIDMKIVLDSVDEVKEILMEFIERVEGVLNEIFAEKD